MEQFTGKVWILGDDIDTDIIIPTEYLALPTVEDMKQYGFSPLRPELAGQIQEGDIIVAGKNFGCGSSREQAPEIIKALKVKCVIAKSYARIFFRNSINNGRIDDLRVAAEIVKGKQVDPKVRFIVAPASKAVYIQALEEGIITTLMEAGAMVMNCNCSVCWGSCQGVIGENEVLISTGTRNFKGRAGAPSSKVYLASAATVAASALAGYITEPEA